MDGVRQGTLTGARPAPSREGVLGISSDPLRLNLCDGLFLSVLTWAWKVGRMTFSGLVIVCAPKLPGCSHCRHPCSDWRGTVSVLCFGISTPLSSPEVNKWYPEWFFAQGFCEVSTFQGSRGASFLMKSGILFSWTTLGTNVLHPGLCTHMCVCVCVRACMCILGDEGRSVEVPEGSFLGVERVPLRVILRVNLEGIFGWD